MDIDSVIILEEGTKWELLDKVIYQDQTYFLAEMLDKDSNPLEEYAILKATQENEDYFIEKCEDEQLLVEILKLFTKNFATLIAQLKDEDLINDDEN